MPDPLNQIAQERFGIQYVFPYQRLVITNILRAAAIPGFRVHHDPGEEPDTNPHQIAILPTGAGKSLCFMLPAVLLPGMTLVVFPLLSLMADQARRLEESGISGAVLRGGQTTEERKKIWRQAEAGQLRMILTNPETALSPEILEQLRKISISHLVIDEMHTVSEWGDSFRPAYLEIGRLSKDAGIPMVTAFTATASDHILNRVREILFPVESPNIVTANPDRPNIAYCVVPSLCKDHDLVRLLRRNSSSRNTLPNIDLNTNPVARPAIVFCGTRRNTERTALMLRTRLQEKNIYFYHAGLDKEEKSKVERWFFDSDDGILIATCAYGMGVDKKNVRTVIHREPPSSVEAYLQESGRGGRDREQAYAVLLFGREDLQRETMYAGTPEGVRYSAVLEFAKTVDRCRRETLLQALGATPEACFGCDVCRGEAMSTPDDAHELSFFLKVPGRMIPPSVRIDMLTGRITESIIADGLWRSRWFGCFSEWDPKHLEQALSELEIPRQKGGRFQQTVCMILHEIQRRLR